MFKVISAGPQSLFQDMGRFHMAGSGVAPSGNFDRMSAARANHAMGNDPRATVVEVLFGGLELEALAASHVVVAGMRCPVTVTDAAGRSRASYSHTLIDLEPGDRLLIGPAESGMRGYLAVRGGFHPPAVLGSCATDLMSGLGPAPLQDGDILEVGNCIAEEAWWPRLRQLPTLWPREEVRTLSVVPGPRSDWFSQESMAAFFGQVYEVSPQSNRIGVRVTGEVALERSRDDELPSEGMVRGSIQVPPNGMPVIFGPDYPVTGGYPVIGVLTRRSSDYSAQCAPGDKIRFIRAS